MDATEPKKEIQFGARIPVSLRDQLRAEANKLRRSDSWMLREILAERYETAREAVAPIVE